MAPLYCTLHQDTPLVKSAALTKVLASPSGREVYLKLDNLQPGGRWHVRLLTLAQLQDPRHRADDAAERRQQLSRQQRRQRR